MTRPLAAVLAIAVVGSACADDSPCSYDDGYSVAVSCRTSFFRSPNPGTCPGAETPAGFTDTLVENSREECRTLKLQDYYRCARDVAQTACIMAGGGDAPRQLEEKCGAKLSFDADCAKPCIDSRIACFKACEVTQWSECVACSDECGPPFLSCLSACAPAVSNSP